MTSRRDEVLAAALELLDEVGLDALTTRRLAERLGVAPGALYRHFASKRALLGAMVDRMAFGGPDADDLTAAPPEDALELLRWSALRARDTMLTRRDGARLLTTYLVPAAGPAVRSWEGLVAAVAAVSSSPADATSAVDTVFAYTNGYTIEEQARNTFPLDPARRARGDAGFRAGLDLIINGIRARQRADRRRVGT